MTKAWNTAWVVGGSTGLGAELVRILAEEGITTYVSARDKQKLMELSDGNDHVREIQLDVTDKDACNSVTAEIFSFNKTLPDLIILNAAVYSPMDVQNFDVDKISTMTNVNYMGIVNMFAALLPYRGMGNDTTIAAVTSPSGWRGLPGGIGYGSSKAAVINLMESMKPELDYCGIDLRVINPGFIKTRLTDKNEFKMPQLMTAEMAAKKTLKGLRTSKFDIAFPNPFLFSLKCLRILPYWLYFRLTKNLR
jgi:short-subunit dehydrogenase